MNDLGLAPDDRAAALDRGDAGQDVVDAAPGSVAGEEDPGAALDVLNRGTEEPALDVTISWTDGDSHGSAAMPLSDYRSHVASQAIQLDGPQAILAPAGPTIGRP